MKASSRIQSFYGRIAVAALRALEGPTFGRLTLGGMTLGVLAFGVLATGTPALAMPTGSAAVPGFVLSRAGQTTPPAQTKPSEQVLPAEQATPADHVDAVGPSKAVFYALRLHPGADLWRSIATFAKVHHIRAGFVDTCVGSLTRVSIRLANQHPRSVYNGHFEIVSLVGTVEQGGSHLHLSVSDEHGRTIGGHLMDGCRVYTTAEIVLGDLTGLVFSRPIDPATTYHELSISRAPAS